jgi:lipopolysaccharide transport system permease protein
MLWKNRLFHSVTNLRTSPADVKATRPAEGLKTLYLFVELIKRDFRLRFTGSALGVAWAILQPLSLVVLYWFVFTLMIPPRSPSVAGQNYVLFLICGLIPWIGINEGILRGTTSIVDNAPMVRRLAFRSEILVAVPNASALLFELIALALFTIFLAGNGQSLSGVWLLPFALMLQLAFQTGIAWFLAAVFVFFRDVMQLLAFFLSILFYLSPILYPVAGRFEAFFMWNPMTPLLGLFRSALLAAPIPEVTSVVFLLTVTSAVFVGGLFFFRRAQASLVDLI